MLQPLPIGEQTFRKVSEGGYLYVDKTRYIYELIRYPSGVYFLARPRRFGKSLLISTLEEIFLGNKELFRGLWLYASDYEWTSHPVIRLDFSRHPVKNAETLEQVIDYFTQELARTHAITLRGFDYQSRFDNLVVQLSEKFAPHKVVILIDEYDHPIINNIENIAEAKRIREVLKGFYTTLKALGGHLRFLLLTGVSKFSRVGVFSGLNNLEDMTMDPIFAAALGITEAEIDQYLGEYVAAAATHTGVTTATLREQMQYWYNGFCFAQAGERVYNPFSLLQFFKKQYFNNYWFETGTPTFLIKLIRERDFDVRQLDRLKLRGIVFNTYEIEQLDILPLLFQTGYLTIKGYEAEHQIYELSYPNYEVEDAFRTWLLGAFSQLENSLSDSHLGQLLDALKTNNLNDFFQVLTLFFARIPYDLHLKQEKYYQTIFYLIFTLLNLRIDAEKRTNRGRIDTVIELANDIYIFEFKFDGNEQAALQQIKDKGYADLVRGRGKTIHLVGVNFASAQRSVAGWQMETIGNG